MEYPQMFWNGKLTEAGQEIVNYMESTLDGVLSEADDRAEALNRLPGHIKHYFVNVHGTKTETATQFVERYERSSVKYAWNDMMFLQEQTKQAETIEETADKTSKLEESLNQLMEELQAVKKELATEKGRVTKLSKRLQEQETQTEEPEVEEPEVEEPETDEPEATETEEDDS